MIKKLALLIPLLVLAGCNSPQEAPPAEVGDFPPDYVISATDSLPESTETDGEDSVDEGEDQTDGDGDTTEDESGDGLQEDLLTCREENADVTLEMESVNKKLELCQKELAENTVQKNESSDALANLNNSHLNLIKNAIINTEQPDFPFRTCGQVGTFLKTAWFEQFTRALTEAKIRFSNGFLETSDLFGGCQSDEGKMAFFLGAERDSDLQFMIIKYDITEQKVLPALMLDDASTAAVTAFGKREGSFVNFPADDGRVFRYYYSANIVTTAP